MNRPWFPQVGRGRDWNDFGIRANAASHDGEVPSSGWAVAFSSQLRTWDLLDTEPGDDIFVKTLSAGRNSWEGAIHYSFGWDADHRLSCGLDDGVAGRPPLCGPTDLLGHR